MIPVVIVGLGRIGAGNENLAGRTPLSHLAAVLAVRGFAVTGLVETDPDRRAAAAGKMPTAATAAVLSALPPAEGEVIVLCTPPGKRKDLFEQTLARQPHLVIAEKPLADELGVARDIVAQAEAAGVPVRVNFNRRFDGRLQAWRRRAPMEPMAAVVTYGKGFLNYASHAVDLLIDWYGPVESVRALDGFPADEVDPQVSFHCRMTAGFDVHFVAPPSLGYDLFDIEIIGRHDRLTLRAGGAETIYEKPVEGLHYNGYAHLSASESDAGPVGGFVELYEAVRDHLTKGQPLGGCDGRAALAGMAVLEAARVSAARGCVPVRPSALIGEV